MCHFIATWISRVKDMGLSIVTRNNQNFPSKALPQLGDIFGLMKK